MISAIQSNLVAQRPAPRFNEGAGTSNTGKITAIALSVLACLASFMLLPAEGAFLASAGILALLSLLTCCNGRGGETISQIVPIILNNSSSSNSLRSVSPIVQSRTYYDVVNHQPVLNVGPRVFDSQSNVHQSGERQVLDLNSNRVQIPNDVVDNQPVRNVGPRVPVGGASRGGYRGGHRSVNSAPTFNAASVISVSQSPARGGFSGNQNAHRVPVGRG